MFKGHPKGLYVLFFSNMGERFGYYTMFAILVLYLQDHFAFTAEESIFFFGGIFMTSVSLAPLIGGIVADAWLGYGKTVFLGLLTMTIGYILMAVPTGGSIFPVVASIGVIALGVGLFKGNLAVIVGNLYEDKKITHLRDAAFNVFYMGINIGAVFAPFAASGIKNFVMGRLGYVYEPELMTYARDHVLDNASMEGARVSELVQTNLTSASTQGLPIADISNLSEYAQNYYDSASLGYNLGFGIAAISMIVSLLIFQLYKKHYKHADYRQKDKISENKEAEMTPKQVQSRLIALGLVFLVVIFFWMALMQGGATLTDFAKKYTDLTIDRFLFMLYSIKGLLAILGVIIGITIFIDKTMSSLWKRIGALCFVLGAGSIAYMISQLPAENAVTPEIFQMTNPFFIILLTPPIVGLFTYLAKKKKEPSPPSKITIGMFLTTIAFTLMIIAAMGLPLAKDLGGNALPADGSYQGIMPVSPYFLVGFYFILTIGELFLSPMGMSFVAKISPPKLRGTMQAGWLVTGAISNFLLGLMGAFYQNWDMWKFFMFMSALCLAAALIMWVLLGYVNRMSKN